MALSRVIAVLVTLLASLAVAGAVSDCTNECWEQTITTSGCQLGIVPPHCVCFFTKHRNDFLACNEKCISAGLYEGLSPDQMCDMNISPREDTQHDFHHERDAQITPVPAPDGSLRERDPSTTLTAHPLGPGFCGLPGTFCFGDGEDDAEQATPVVDNRDAQITAAPAAANEILPRDPSTTLTAHPLGPGFCGLPGTFCFDESDEDQVNEAASPVERDAEAAAQWNIAESALSDLLAEPQATTLTAHPLGEGFCGLPGTFCFGDSGEARANEAASPVERDAEAEAQLNIANSALHELTADFGSPTLTANPLPPGFCGLPGTFCAGSKVLDEDAAEAQPAASVPTSTSPTEQASLQRRQPTVGPVKRLDGVHPNDGSLPFRNTKTLIHENIAYGSAIEVPWKAALIAISVFGVVIILI